MSGTSWWERLLAWGHSDRVEPVDDEEAVVLLRTDPAAARRWLAKRQKELSQELMQVTRAYDERLQELAGRVSRAEVGPHWSDEAAAILAKQQEVARMLLRLELAERDTPALMTEWQDWQRYLAEVGEPKEARQAERLELLRSELTLRGVRLAGVSSRNEPASMAMIATLEEEPEADEAEAEASTIELPGEDLVEWDLSMEQEATSGAALRPFDLSAGEINPQRMVEELKQLRDRQGELRLLDRRRGIRRDRLRFFETV